MTRPLHPHDTPDEPCDRLARIKWRELAGPRTFYTHGPEHVPLGLPGRMSLGPIFEGTDAAAEDCRRHVQVHREHRVVYKLVPVSYHRALSGRVD